MKKTLAAVAVLGAFAGSALAADVTVYGRLDTGLAYDKTQIEANGVEIADKHSFSMDSGNLTGSRVGIKGSEEISEGLTVGFVLEKGFKSDSGVDGDSKKAFDRESSIFVKTDFGSVYAGRIGTVWSDSGSIGKYAAIANVDGTGHSGIGNLGIGLLQISSTRYDNTLAYVSPKFGGFEAFAQYSMGEDGQENKAATDRYAAIGADYQAGGLQVAMVVENINEKSAGNEVDDTLAVHVGGQYDFGVAKVSAAAVYFDNANDFAGIVAKYNAQQTAAADKKVAADDASGYGVSLGVAVPVAGGTFYTTAGYIDGDAKVEGVNADAKAYNIGVNYQYNLSKQVRVYTGAGYSKYEIDAVGLDAEQEDISVGAGMVYYF